MSPSAPASQGQPALVTAVVVSHDGHAWIPRLLKSLLQSARLPDQVVAVDTGSSDDSAELLATDLGEAGLVRVAGHTSFGGAVAAGLRHADAQAGSDAGAGDQWMWVLHDDMAVDPDALRELLAAVADDPSLDIVGPKVREWPSRKRILEVGLTATGTGRRDTGVDPGEYDQGQHDRSRDVLAVGSAGMLVRRSVWDALGGFDPAMPFFSDDLDFGWRAARAGYRTRVCPDAVVYHAAAAARGRREVDAVRGTARRLARKHTMLTVLANCRGWAVPLIAVRLLVGSLLRAVGLLLIRHPRHALDEVLAVAAVLLRPGRLWTARRRRRGTNAVAHAEVRPLLAPWWAPYRRGVDTVGQVVAEAVDAVAARRPERSRGVETGPVSEESESLDGGAGPLRWLLRHPMAAMVSVLGLLALIGQAGYLFGGGLLRGGALLPAPPGVLGWWDLYLESWHPVALGSDVPAPAFAAVLAVAGTLLLGQEWLVVDLLIGGAVPLSALTAYVALRRLVPSWPIRIWAAVAYGVMPVLTGAVAQGRIGTVVAAILAPLALWPMVRAVSAPTPEQRLRAGLASGLLLAVVIAFAPVVWPLTAVAAVGMVGLQVGARRADLRSMSGLLAAVVLPLVVLLPWTLHLGLEPARWLTDVGYAAGVPRIAQPPGWAVGLGRPGGPGDAPVWLSVGVALAAVAALFRTDRRRAVLAAWGVGAVALALVAWQRSEGIWPGFTVIAIHGAAVVAAAVAADGAIDRLGAASFGWRQPLAGLVALLAAVSPVLALGWWVAADDTLLERRDPVEIPAFMADAQRDPSRPRTLVVSPEGSAVGFHLSRGPGMYLGQQAVLDVDPVLTDVVGRLVSDPSPDDVADLAALGVTYVVLTQPDETISAAIDAAPGVQPASAGDAGAAAWRLELPTGGARLVSGNDLAGAEVIPSHRGEVDTRIGDGSDDRRVLLAERVDSGWSGSLNGTALEPADPTGAGTQVFAVPGESGQLVIEHSNGRGWWLALQVTVLVLVLVLAMPGRRRTDVEEDDR